MIFAMAMSQIERMDKMIERLTRERDEWKAAAQEACDENNRLRDALESVMRYCEELTRGTTHYEGCADGHPYCKIWSIAQQAIAREALAQKDSE
jgi:hypothetical protein